MDHGNHPRRDAALKEVVIPRENAVFWMDSRGYWQNRHGRFEHKRIIDHFNRAIRRDDGGYYVTQVRGDIREKVYFTYADTPLFVIRILLPPPLRLVLNTGDEMRLDPAALFVEADQMYLRRNDERIKFAERALVALAPFLNEDEDGLIIDIEGRRWPIADQTPLR